MKTYTGTKTIKAIPMTRKEYVDYRGWSFPVDEDPYEMVYLVEYEADENSAPNHADHDGYISMSPKHVFDKAYRESGTFKDRLIIERDDLAEKIRKIRTAFQDMLIPESEVDVLAEQLNYMEAYCETLEKRINRLN